MSYRNLPYDTSPRQGHYWRERKRISDREVAIRIVLFTLAGFCLALHLLMPD